MIAARPLTVSDRQRLCCILALLGSVSPGERAGAALAADRMVRSHGTTWADLLGTPPPQPGPYVRPADRWRHDLAMLERHRETLGEAYTIFLVSMRLRERLPGLAARARLAEIADRLRARGLE